MSTTTIKPRKKRKFTVRNLFTSLPRKFLSAPICVLNGLDYPFFVQCVELREDAGGMRVVVLHREPKNPC